MAEKKFVPKTKLTEPPKKKVRIYEENPSSDLFGEAPSEPEPSPEPEPQPELESNVAFTERMLNEMMSSRDFTEPSSNMLRNIRSWLYDNCQLKIQGDKESGLFAENIRMGVDVPAACVSAARLEYVMSNLSTGSYSRSLYEKVKNEEMEMRKAMGALESPRDIEAKRKKKEKQMSFFKMEG